MTDRPDLWWMTGTHEFLGKTWQGTHSSNRKRWDFDVCYWTVYSTPEPDWTDFQRAHMAELRAFQSRVRP